MKGITELVTPAATIAVVVLLAACGSSSGTPGQASGTPSTAGSPASTTPTPSPAAFPSPSPSPTPAATPPVGSINLGNCPPYASGQHPLGSPGPPGAGVHVVATLNWQGCGNVTLPTGTSRFMTGDNWQLAFAATCPNELDYGEGAMGPNVTFNEVLIDGTAGPDTESGAGPWTDSFDGIMAHGGNYQIRVTSIDPRCRWHVAIYPS